MWRVTVSEMALRYCYQTEQRTVYIQELHIRQFQFIPSVKTENQEQWKS